MTFSIMTLETVMLCHYAECRYAECRGALFRHRFPLGPLASNLGQLS